MLYFFEVLRHKYFVLIAGFRVGGISLWQLITHDWTKFLPREFVAYRRKFTLGIDDETEWRVAVNHHYNRNPHHWEYWVHPDGKALPMPTRFIREMVADWLAAGRSYQGNWDITVWLKRSYPRMRLHQETKKYLALVLAEVGITGVVEG